MEFGLLSVTPVPQVLAWGTSPGPTTYEEWQAAIWEVKSLNQSQQYKHCVSRCKQLLEAGAGPIERIHETSLYYYSAVSYVSMAQAAHVYSASKIPLLKSALENFVAADKALPENLVPPVLNPDQTYSPVEWSASPDSRTNSGSPLTFTDSPIRSETPLESFLLPEVSPIFDTKAQLARYGILTPPHSVYPSTPPSSSESLITAFVVTPHSIPPDSPPRQLSPIEDLSPVDGDNGQPMPAEIPAFAPPSYKLSSMSQNFSYPIGGSSRSRDGPSSLSGDKELASFDNARSGVPIGDSLINNITRMLDGSDRNGAEDDPFISKRLSPRICFPIQFSPIRFPSGLEDPRKQSELVPSPLSVRKESGEVIKCARSMILCGGASPKNSASENDTCKGFNENLLGVDSRPSSTLENCDNDTQRIVRPRPPRLPLRIIPCPQVNITTSQSILKMVFPEPKRLSPIATTPTPEFTPETSLQTTPFITPKKNSTGSSSHFLVTPSGSPEQGSWSSYSTPSPTSSPVISTSAARIEVFNSSTNFLRGSIPKEIAWLQEQIDHVNALQLIHRLRSPVTPLADFTRPRSFWTVSSVRRKVSSAFRHSSPEEGLGPNVDKFGNLLRVEVQVQRIARLRNENWKSGIRATHSVWKGTEYYEKFCEEVLADVADTEERKGCF